MPKAAEAINPIVAIITADGARGRNLRRQIREACKKAGEPLTSQAIFAWKDSKTGVPPKRVQVVAKVLRMPKSQIRPDLFGR